MSKKLIVTEPFGDYSKGQEITDQAVVQSILESHNSSNVVPVDVPDTPAKQAK